MYGSVNTIRDAPSSQGQKSNSKLTEPISLGLGANPLAVHKRNISRWIYPTLSRDQGISVAKAKKAVARAPNRWLSVISPAQ